jgi:hypothetical protein
MRESCRRLFAPSTGQLSLPPQPPSICRPLRGDDRNRTGVDGFAARQGGVCSVRNPVFSGLSVLPGALRCWRNSRVWGAFWGPNFGSSVGVIHELTVAGGSFISMTKAELHELVDALPDASLDAAGALLRRAQDPVLAQLDAAPYDDEPLTDEDRAALDAAKREPGVSWSEVSSELSAG